jgi:DNA helicase-2/ATP-dependent DNA helicase PcrA
LRRYGLKYHVVGGFSFYERAEIKDMISYLKVIQNPDDSIALQRVINTPTRGIGKSTMEIIERVALETGLSLWGAVGEVISRQLLPNRATSALKCFRDIIEDARAMLFGEFAGRLSESATQPDQEVVPAAIELPADEGDLQHAIEFSPFDDATDFAPDALEEAAPEAPPEKVEGFRAPGEAANTAELLKFLLDRTGYIKQLEAEDTPEAFSRIENLRELVNAAMDSRDRGETLDEFLDHAALVSDTDKYDESQQITLMTLHSAKGLEFPLVVLAGMEEGLFPHSRTLMNPDEIEEERRLCYVGMTRAMDTLVLTRARYRRRYGTDMPEASVPSRFLEEVPPELIEDLGSPRREVAASHFDDYGTSTHYDYENEDQSVRSYSGYNTRKKAPAYSGATYNSIDNIAEFFASRGKKFTRPKVEVPAPTGKVGFKAGQRVKHPKYGEGTVFKREGEGEDAKLTVQFPRFGLKKLVEKYAQLEKV